ncbi:MAG: hypothetical protein OQK50_05205 [Deltaproteobacteria bacterium]|jgi:hypothetical protein|nr:hypothetical protein [Deltaproteobacteria bacterium]MCW8892468.1 hypothetical protein [Deltaproteobacteria bacterium]MCW9049711.1 hypothetical protein [Deltaproteobacteria bacterium]MEE4292241.1 hypothetical protein [Cycloclasticus sp.]
MSISERYRHVLEQIEQEADRFYETLPESTVKALRSIDIAVEELQDWVETVGEIPQLQLESKLAPVLLKVHGQLDHARVLLENDEQHKAGEKVWELEQMVYRLLNDL